MLLGEARAGFCAVRPAFESASYSGVLRRRSVAFSDGWLRRVSSSFEVKMDLGFDIKLKAKIAGGKRARWTDNGCSQRNPHRHVVGERWRGEEEWQRCSDTDLETGHGGSTAERAGLRSHPRSMAREVGGRSALHQWRRLAHPVVRRRSSILVCRELCWFGCWKK